MENGLIRDMKVIKYLMILSVILITFSCGNLQDRIIEESENKDIPEINCRPLHYKEFIIDTVFYSDKLVDGYGLISGFVLLVNGLGDTVKGLHADEVKAYIHVVDTNLKQRVDGMYSFMLPVGDYKICVEANDFFPVVNRVKIRNKEELKINYFIDKR